MKSDKKKIIKIAIIVILALTILSGAVTAALYFTTDVFKTDKELFLTYALESDIVDIKLENYLEKLSTTPYKADTSISLSSTESTENKILEKVDVTIASKKDVVANEQEHSINVLYNKENILPLSLRQVGTMVGFKTDHIGSRYIATDISTNIPSNEEWGEEITKTINSLVELSNTLKLDDDMKNHVIATYKNILIGNLQTNQFSKIESDESIGYTLEMSQNEYLTIIKTILTTLQQDTKTKEYISKIMYFSDIDTILEEKINEINTKLANTQVLENENFKIIVWVKNSVVTMIEAYQSNESVFKIEKISTDSVVKYNIFLNLLEEEQKINLELKFSGINTLIQVAQNHIIEIEENGEVLTTRIDINTSFVESILIEPLDDETSLIITNSKEEENEALAIAIIDRLQTVYLEQLDKISEASGGLFIPSTSTSTQMTIQENNDQYSIYEGQEIRGSIVKGLFSVIEKNITNGTCTIKQIYLDKELYKITDTSDIVKELIDTALKYQVKMNVDSYGYIEEIELTTIEEKN